MTTTTGPTTTTTAPTTTTTVPAPAGQPLLQRGDSGQAVTGLQQRLSALGYWLGPADGTFGLLTEQAVVALQKVAGLGRDGVVGPATAQALDRAALPVARSTTGHVVEIDLARQVLVLVSAGHVDTVLAVSSGNGQPYSSGGTTELAVTPAGRFAVFRQVDGADVSPLGTLWRPKYFVGGIAVHGYAEVPPFPASHGCVRVSIPAMDWIWSTGVMPVGTPVWVY